MYNIPIVKPAPTPLQQLIGGFKGGLNIANALQQASAARRQQAFLSKQRPLQLQQLQQQEQAGRTQQAFLAQQRPLQLQKIQAEISQTLQGRQFAGIVGQVQGLDKLKSQYGPNSPEYLRALGAFQSGVRLKDAKAKAYSSALRNVPTPVKNQMIAALGSKATGNQESLQHETYPSSDVNSGIHSSEVAGENLPSVKPLDDPTVRKVAADAAQMGTITSDQSKRIYAGDRFQTSANNVLYWIDKASPYFGITGQLQLKKDMTWSLAHPKQPPPAALRAWYNMEQGLENMNLQGAIVEGVPADTISRGDYKKVFELHRYVNNYDSARSTLMNAVNMVKGADIVNRAHISKLRDPKTEKEIVKKATIIQPLKTAPSEIVRARAPDGTIISGSKDKMAKLLKDHPDIKVIQ